MGRRRSAVVVLDSLPARASRPGGTEEGPAPFDPAHRGEWWWRQPKWTKREWQLEQDGQLVGAYQGEGLFSNMSRMRFAGAAFEMHRSWRGHADVRPAGEKEPLAKFVPRLLGGGRIEPAAGEPLQWVRTGAFWKRSSELQTTEGILLVRFESHDSFLTHEVQIVPEDSARRRPDLLPLLALAAAIVFAPKRHS